MSTDPVTDVDEDGHGNARCWCCGTTEAPNRRIRLGNHPEVHLCLGCAHFVHQQARRIEDEENPGAASLVRDRFRSLRAVVIRQGWHRSRFIGGRLRWLDTYLP